MSLVILPLFLTCMIKNLLFVFPKAWEDMLDVLFDWVEKINEE